MACQAGMDKPFQYGLENYPWGISLAQADSLSTRDSAWKKITYFIKSTGRGEILGLSHRARNYFLEFEGNKGFCKFTYLDSISDFESLNTELTTAYGAPDFWDNKNLKRESKMWNSAGALMIQLIRTEYQYIMTIEKK